MHLIGEAYGGDVGRLDAGLGHNGSRRFLEVLPPAVGILLGPAGVEGLDGGFRFGEEIGGNGTARSSVDERSLYGGCAYVIT